MLGGVRVLEFGQYVAGPLAGMLLGDLGAEVIKIEGPGGDPLRVTPAYETYNRNKQILRLDLKSETGRGEAMRLIEGADVVIDAYRPGLLNATGVLDRVGGGRRPDLITCVISGFAAQVGLPDAAAWDDTIGAALGLHRSSDPDAPNPAPVFSPLPLASTYAGLLSATSIAAALVARGRSGLGQDIEVPIHSAMFYGLGFSLLRTNWAGGPPPLRNGVPNPMIGLYRCSDDRWIQLHASLDKFVDAFVAELGLEDWRDAGLFEGIRARTDAAKAAELQGRLEILFAQAPSQEWEARLSAAGLSCAVCRTGEEWLHEKHAEEAGLVVELPSRHGPMRQPGRLVQAASLERRPLRPRSRADAGIGWTERSERATPPFERISAALEGVKVLDLSLILAGPTVGRVMAEFGADVTKIDFPDARTSEAFWLDANRGKRSLILDLKSAPGQAVFWKLAESADVVIENFRSGVAERLGVGFDQVAGEHPRVIYASLNCYGYSGPFAGRPGWEHLAQAVTGMQVRASGRDGRPKLASLALNDYGTGLAGALGVLAALYERQRTGTGQRVTTALAATAGILQAPYLFDLTGGRHIEAEAREARGRSAWSRLYEAQDGWLYLHCPQTEVRRLVAFDGFSSIRPLLARGEACGADSAVASELARIFGQKPVREWLRTFEGEEIAVMAVRRFWDLFDDHRLRDAGLIVTTESEDYGTVEHVGIPHRLSLTPAVSGRPAPPPGADTEQILREIGYSRKSITALKRGGVVRTSVF